MSDSSQPEGYSLWNEEVSRGKYIVPLPRANWKLRRASRSLTRGIPRDQIGKRYGYFTAASPDSHQGAYRWAIDFLVPDGTPVLAAAAGKVCHVKEDGTLWGELDEALEGTEQDVRLHLNSIAIRHQNGEISEYCHLEKGSVSAQGIKVGSAVHEGQVIGIVGKSGWTDRDHLHFIVIRNLTFLDRGRGENTFKSLQVCFDNWKQFLRRFRVTAHK